MRLALPDDLDAEEEESAPPPGDHPSVPFPSVTILPAPLRYGHFEVARDADGEPVELGRGAMGTTYRAQDTVLRLPVALKVISRKVASHPTARARFLREARAAARLQHVNVASVTYYGEQDGECFYAMELIEGETLAERVRRLGPLPPAEAVEVGVQVARALAAAEVVGVVHRDLKPSNLMLVNLPRPIPGAATEAKQAGLLLHVKVIDWGLAKAAAGSEDESAALGADQTRDAFVGTPAFASPEQFTRASGRRVDTRSDIYSLGVTLWYLLCGRVPFVGRSLDDIHLRQQWTLPLVQLKEAKVPRALSKLLENLLAFDPADRPQSARELLDSLRRCQERQVNRAFGGPRHRRGWQLAGALVLALVLGIEATPWGWPRARNPAIVAGEKPSLAVLPFENLGPDRTETFFTVGVQNEITDNLAHISQLNVLSPRSTLSYGSSQRRDYASIGKTLGVGYLLEGSVQRTDGRVHIVTRLVDTRQTIRTWTNEYNGTPQDIFGLESKLVTAVVTQMRVALTESEKLVIEHPPTSDTQAHDLYLRAGLMDLQEASDSNDVRNNLEKASLLEAAVARDPKFVNAYCRLSNTHFWLYNSRALLPPSEQNIDHRGLADVALAQARRWGPDNGYVHYATAVNLYLASHNRDQAMIELDLARRTLPSDMDVEFMSGIITFDQGHWREGMGFLEKAVALDPLYWKQQFDVAQYYRRLRRYEDYNRTMKQVFAAAPAEKSGYYQLTDQTCLFDARGDLERYRRTLQLASPTDDPSGRLRFFYGFLLHLFGRDPGEAAAVLASYHVDPVRHGTHLYPLAWFEAELARLRGDDAGAKAAFAAARQHMDKEANTHPEDGWALSMIAVCDAGLGHKEDAAREALHAVELTPYGHNVDDASIVRSNLALVYAWTEQPDLALTVLEGLADKPGSFDIPTQPSYGDLRLNPCWDRLRNEPRFEAVTRRFQQPVPGS